MGRPKEIGEVWVAIGNQRRVPMYAQYGAWAVTQDPINPELYAITHLPTGMAAPRRERLLSVAKRIAKALQTALPELSLQDQETLSETALRAIAKARRA